MLRHAALAVVFASAVLLAAESAFAQRGANAQARVSLDRQLPAINFANVAMRDAIDFLRDVSGANIHVNWRAIEASGIGPDTVINIKLRQVPLRKVLRLLLSEAAGGESLAFYLDDGVVEITTRELSDSIMYTRVYPVQDLLVEPPDITDGPQLGGLNANSNDGRSGGSGRSGSSGRSGGSSRSGGGGGGGGGNPFATSGLPFGGTGGGTAAASNKTPKEEELVALITETVYPDMWVQNGGKSSIKFFSGNLIVTAPRSVHEAIGGPID